MIKEIISKLFLKGIELIFGKTVKIQHPFFGQMADVGGYYESRRQFEPIDNIVEIGLEKTSSILGEEQIKFFKWIETNYDLIIEKVVFQLEEEIQEIISEYRINDFKKEFQLTYLYIPKCDKEPFIWEIGFDEVNLLQHYCLIKMRNLEVLNIHIDG